MASVYAIDTTEHHTNSLTSHCHDRTEGATLSKVQFDFTPLQIRLDHADSGQPTQTSEPVQWRREPTRETALFSGSCLLSVAGSTARPTSCTCGRSAPTRRRAASAPRWSGRSTRTSACQASVTRSGGGRASCGSRRSSCSPCGTPTRGT